MAIPTTGEALDGKDQLVDPTLIRGLTQRRYSRRQLLRSAAAGAGSLALASFLAACGSKAPVKPQSTGFDWSKQKKAGQLTFGNWPLYIDKKKVNGQVTHPSLDAFAQQTGITVDYQEVINDYASWFGKLRPQLAAGQSTGFDLIMMEYPKWLPLMMQLDYLIPLDGSLLPNFHRYAAASYQDRSYDPGNKYSVPWQSGITGIGYDIDQTGREITSLQDLFSAEFKGKVGMFNDTEDTPNIALLALGIDPTSSTPDDWKKAADLLMKQRDGGIVRQYYGQGYIGDLQSGNLAVTLAWSADVLQSQLQGYPNLRFVVPDEGGLLWTDCMCIPIGAQHPFDAITYMDFVYKPEIAAMLTDWILNVSPVPDAQQVLIGEGESSVAKNPLVFPTPDMYDRLHGYRILDAQETQLWEDTFLPVYQS